MPPVEAHRVDVEEERDSQGYPEASKKQQQHGAGPFYPLPYGFCPPQYWQQWAMGPPGMPGMPGLTDARGQMMSVPQHYYQGQMAGVPPAPAPPPQPQPQFLAVNVHTDNHQHQSQRADARSTAKHVSVKEKLVKHITRGAEQLLDSRVLIAGLAAFLVPKLTQQLQGLQQRRKKRELFLRFGFA